MNLTRTERKNYCYRIPSQEILHETPPRSRISRSLWRYRTVSQQSPPPGVEGNKPFKKLQGVYGTAGAAHGKDQFGDFGGIFLVQGFGFQVRGSGSRYKVPGNSDGFPSWRGKGWVNRGRKASDSRFLVPGSWFKVQGSTK